MQCTRTIEGNSSALLSVCGVLPPRVHLTGVWTLCLLRYNMYLHTWMDTCQDRSLIYCMLDRCCKKAESEIEALLWLWVRSRRMWKRRSDREEMTSDLRTRAFRVERTTESESKTEKRSHLSWRNMLSLFHPTGNLMEVSFMIHSVWKDQMFLVKCPRRIKNRHKC